MTLAEIYELNKDKLIDGSKLKSYDLKLKDWVNTKIEEANLGQDKLISDKPTPSTVAKRTITGTLQAVDGVADADLVTIKQHKSLSSSLSSSISSTADTLGKSISDLSKELSDSKKSLSDSITNTSTNLSSSISELKKGLVDGSIKVGDAKLLNGRDETDLYLGIHDWISKVNNDQAITVSGDSNTYYPVTITLPTSNIMPTRISVYKYLGTTTPSYEGNHSNGTSSMWLWYEGRFTGWDGNGGYLITRYRDEAYAPLCAKTGVTSNRAGRLVVWLRGGGCTYQVASDSPVSVDIYYEETNIGSEEYPEMVAPTTTLGNRGYYDYRYFTYVGNRVRFDSDTNNKVHDIIVNGSGVPYLAKNLDLSSGSGTDYLIPHYSSPSYSGSWILGYNNQNSSNHPWSLYSYDNFASPYDISDSIYHGFSAMVGLAAAGGTLTAASGSITLNYKQGIAVVGFTSYSNHSASFSGGSFYNGEFYGTVYDTFIAMPYYQGSMGGSSSGWHVQSGSLGDDYVANSVGGSITITFGGSGMYYRVFNVIP